MNCYCDYTINFCEKSNGISVITLNRVICINVGATAAALQIARVQKKNDFVQKAAHFHDLAGRGTSGKKAGLSRQKRDGWQVCQCLTQQRGVD